MLKKNTVIFCQSKVLLPNNTFGGVQPQFFSLSFQYPVGVGKELFPGTS